MEADSPIAQRWELMRERLDERQRRAFAAAEAKVIGRGGVSQVAAATGVARNTILAGMQELEGSSNEFMSGTALARAGSTRRSGGGRKAATHKDPSLVPDLLALVDPTSRGDPESALRWTCKSLRVLADELKAGGHVISHVVVGRLLKDQGYSLQANAKVIEGNQSPDRNAQFEHINTTVTAALRAGQPVISVDTKKKELVGLTRTADANGIPRASLRASKFTTLSIQSLAVPTRTACTTSAPTRAGSASAPITTRPRLPCRPSGAGGSRWGARATPKPPS
jgi:hypothetical protein